jgi:hypothetical protein
MRPQLIDLNRVSIDQFCKLTNSKIKKSTSGKYRDVLDAMRTIAWYIGIERTTGMKGPHQVERLVEPESFSKNSYDEVIRRNKWRQYRLGRHTPSDEFVLKIASRSKQRTIEIFHHVLWDVLREEKLVSDYYHSWIQRIPKKIILTIIRDKSYAQPDVLIDKVLDVRNLKKLELHADLDALALMTICLKHAVATHQSEQAFLLSRYTSQMLLLCGFDISSDCRFSQPLYDYYEKIFFRNAVNDGCFISFPQETFPYLIGRLLDAMYHLDGVNYFDLSTPQIKKYQREVMRGNYGIDFLCLFSPIEQPSGKGELTNPHKIQRCMAEFEMWRWAESAWLKPKSRNQIPDYISDNFPKFNSNS